jgi:putative hydrolase of the HAD superfamily
VAIQAVLFDFGGVLADSPFDAFARYETEQRLPAGFIRSLNATNPDTNAWASLERSDIDFPTFCRAFEAEAREAGRTVDAAALFATIGGDLRPAMIDVVRQCRPRFRTALLTNNFVTQMGGSAHASILDLFDAVIESAVVGVRKPDPRFYLMACEALDVQPSEAVFLDDLGVNLKPARALGMVTIKVGEEPMAAVDELEAVLNVSLR